MKPERQRIKIAEARGWTAIHPSYGEPYGFEPNVTPDNSDPTLALNATWLPNCLNDLNACREMEEEEVIRSHWDTYLEHLISIRWRDAQPDRHPADLSPAGATAAQRCEAFLRTLNLWEDEN